MPPNISDAQCVNNRSELSVRWFIVTLRLILWNRLCCANQRSTLCDSLKYATHTLWIHRWRSPSSVALWSVERCRLQRSLQLWRWSVVFGLRATVYYFPCAPLIIQFLRRITWLNFHLKRWRRGRDHHDRLAIDRTAIITIVNGPRCCGLRVAFVRLSDLWFNFIVNWNSTSLVYPHVSVCLQCISEARSHLLLIIDSPPELYVSVYFHRVCCCYCHKTVKQIKLLPHAIDPDLCLTISVRQKSPDKFANRLCLRIFHISRNFHCA